MGKLITVSEPQLIFVSGPYSAPTEEGRLRNVEAAMNAGIVIIDKGHYPFVPHLTHFLDLQYKKIRGHHAEYELWMQIDLAIVDRCQAYVQLRPSPGADRELFRAEERGKIIYATLDDIPRVVRA